VPVIKSGLFVFQRIGFGHILVKVSERSVVSQFGFESNAYAPLYAPDQRVLQEGGEPLPCYDFMYCNFYRIHKTLHVSPAMAAGVTDKLWSREDVVLMIDQ
jgi:hypothetical protein